MVAPYANRKAMAKAAALLCLALAALLPCNRGYSQDLHLDIPTGAHYSATEQGWTCDDGLKQVAGSCSPDTQDQAARIAFEVFDGQWRCRAGYQRVNGFCVPPTAPAHASLLGDGGRWECDWGFRKVAARCEEVMPPAHAYLDASGRDWVCFPGFERISDRCAPVPSPAPVSGRSPAVNDEPKPTADPKGG
jgi:hypothetical protein